VLKAVHQNSQALGHSSQTLDVYEKQGAVVNQQNHLHGRHLSVNLPYATKTTLHTNMSNLQPSSRKPSVSNVSTASGRPTKTNMSSR